MKKHPTAKTALADQKEDSRVCICMKISQKTLVSTIAGGATDLDQLMQATKAGTGCGTCRVDLIHLLAEHGRTDHDS